MFGPHTPWWRALAGLALALTTTAALAACSSGTPFSSEAGGAAEAQDVALAESGVRPLLRDGPRRRTTSAGAQPPSVAEKRISHGTVVLEADDVAAARAEVQQVVDAFSGEVSESQTETAEDGALVRARLVLRIPVADFQDAMDRIERVGDMDSSDQSSDVVTQEYADLQARVRAQEKSLARLELLFGQAEDIRDIVAIERELSRRQADLDSLKGQLQVLDDQTELSTITVHVERTEQGSGGEDTGFLAGLAAGWSTLQALVVLLVTVVGAVLPFVLAASLVAVPVWLVLRRARRSRPAPPVATAAEGTAE